MTTRNSLSPIRNSSVGFANSGQFSNANMKQSLTNLPARNSMVGGLTNTQLRQSTVPAQNANSRYVYQTNQSNVNYVQQPVMQQSLVENVQLRNVQNVVQTSNVLQQPNMVQVVQQPQQIVQKEIIYQQEPRIEYIEQEPEYLEKIIQVKGPTQVQYIDQPNQYVEKIIQIQEPSQIREIIKEIFVPQIQIEEKIIEVEKPYEVIQWKDVPGEVEIQTKYIKKPMDLIIYEDGEPNFIEEEIHVPKYVTKTIQKVQDVQREHVEEVIDDSKIIELQQEIERLKMKCEGQGINWRIAVEDNHPDVKQHPTYEAGMQRSQNAHNVIAMSQSKQNGTNMNYNGSSNANYSASRNDNYNIASSQTKFNNAFHGKSSREESEVKANRRYPNNDRGNNMTVSKQQYQGKESDHTQNQLQTLLSANGVYDDNYEMMQVKQKNTSALNRKEQQMDIKKYDGYTNDKMDGMNMINREY